MKKCIIFGCGKVGSIAYTKLENIYEIIAWADNNTALWGSKRQDIDIIPPKEIGIKQQTDSTIEVIIAMEVFEEVYSQLVQMNIHNIIIWKKGFLFYFHEGCLYPVEIGSHSFHIKENTEDLHVLFVQTEACIRTHKIACALKKYGLKVFLAYLEAAPEHSNSEYAGIYEEIYPIYTMQQLIDFVNGSDFDFVHSSNQPDFLTVLLNQSNKPIIHDCHDLSSAYISMTPEGMLMEFKANKYSDGVIYPTEGLRQQAMKKFQIPKSKTFVLENYISDELISDRRQEKISKKDGELHCVYEGGIRSDKSSHRYFEEIWLELVKSGVHVHFYSNCDEKYCRYLDSLHEKMHYEGNMTSRQLALEMTKYDVGLCIFETRNNRKYLECASPIKIHEYVNAGLPVVVGDIDSEKDFVEKNCFGKQIDLEGDLYSQIETISKIRIEDNVLQKRGYTLESKIPELLKFYKTCVKGECIEQNTDF